MCVCADAMAYSYGCEESVPLAHYTLQMVETSVRSSIMLLNLEERLTYPEPPAIASEMRITGRVIILSQGMPDILRWDSQLNE